VTHQRFATRHGRVDAVARAVAGAGAGSETETETKTETASHKGGTEPSDGASAAARLTK